MIRRRQRQQQQQRGRYGYCRDSRQLWSPLSTLLSSPPPPPPSSPSSKKPEALARYLAGSLVLLSINFVRQSRSLNQTEVVCHIDQGVSEVHSCPAVAAEERSVVPFGLSRYRRKFQLFSSSSKVQTTSALREGARAAAMLPLTTTSSNSSTNYSHSSTSSNSYSHSSTSFSHSSMSYSNISSYSRSSSTIYSNSSNTNQDDLDLSSSNCSNTVQAGTFLPLPSCSHSSSSFFHSTAVAAASLSMQQQQPEQQEYHEEVQQQQQQQRRPSSEETLSDDSVVRSSECDICGKDITHLVQQVHYGARACFSCRAFFRRAQKAKRRPRWRCKKEGACLINEKTRRFCAKCRYIRCIKVGMRESLVLTEEEKTHRFRKVLKKKRRLAKQAKMMQMQQQDDDHDQEAPQQQQQQQEEEEEDPEENLAAIASPAEDHLQDLDQPTSFSLSPPPPPPSKGIHPPLVLPKEESGAESRSSCCSREGGNGAPILKVLQDVHAGLLSPYLDESHIAELVRLLERRFRSLAFAQDAFLSLASAQRNLLLAQNTPLYLQSILCQYFMATNGPEQATVILDEEEEEDKGGVRERFRVSIGDLDRCILSLMFGEQSLLKNTLVKLLRSVCDGLRGMRDFFDFQDVHKMILYEGLQASVTSTDCSLVQDIFSQVKNLQLIKQYQNDLELLAYISMAMCCFQHLRHSSLEVRSPFAISTDNFCMLVQERARAEVRRIVVLHERHIDAGLDALVREKAPKIAALFLARLDLAQTLEEQLGILNLACFPSSLAGRRERIKIFHCNPAIKAILQPRQDRFQRLLNKFKLYLGNPDLFLLLVLLSIFGPSVSKLQTAYLSVLSAVMANLPPGMEEEGGPASPPCASVNNCLDNLDELSNLCACFTFQQV